MINVLCTNTLIQGFGYRKRCISTKIIKEVIADYTGKKPQRLWRPWIVLAGTTALLAALFWFSPYQEVALSKINLAKGRQFMEPSVASRTSPPQETPTAGRDSLPPASISTPEQPGQPPKPAATPPSPETSESAPAVPTTVYTVPTPAAPTTVRTVKKGDQVSRVALEGYGSSNNAVLEWIRKNNPQLRD